MSGHSKWSTIKHKKAATDAKRAKIFTKIARVITIAARAGGGDPETNPTLRRAISDARTVNMPNDNIDRAIMRGTGSGDGVALEELTIEAYGPEGAAIIIEAITDNRNRTLAEVKHLLSQHDVKFAEQGSVMWAFDKQEGELTAKNELSVSEDAIKKMRKLFEALDDHDDVQNLYTNVDLGNEDEE